MSYNKLNEDPPPTYQATAPPQEPPPKYEAAYPPQGVYAASNTTVITGQPVILTQSLGPYSKVVICPSCQASVTTRLDYEPGILTWLASGMICLFGCWAGCCLIPFCLNDLQDVKHDCPSCGHRIGIYRRIS